MMSERNQCDGCRRKLAVRDGNHVDSKGWVIMGCTAALYNVPEAPTYTPELLAEFDKLTARCSSRDQMTRIEARLKVSAFEKEHGSAICAAMFAELQRRDLAND